MKELGKGWKKIKAEKGPNIGPLTTRFDFLENPRNQKEIKVAVIEGRDACNVIAITKEKKMVLVRQLRFGTGDISLEPPGGLMNEGEDRLEAAKRELQEETGYTSQNWRFQNTVAAQPVFMNNYIHTFVAMDAALTHPRNMDDEEDIEILEFELAEVKEMLKNGGFTHPHAVSSVTQFLLQNGYLV